jgi:hypothetical protein
LTLIVTASAASARLLAPPAGGATQPATQVLHHQARLFAWQIGLVVVAAAVLVAITATLVARRVRIGSHRPAVS